MSPLRAALLLIVPLTLAIACSTSQHVPPPYLPATTEPEVVADTYVVQRGDYLAAIALRFDVPLRQLIELNDISDASRIEIGQVILLSEKTTVVPLATQPPTAEPPPVAAEPREWWKITVGADQVELAGWTAAFLTAGSILYVFLRGLTHGLVRSLIPAVIRALRSRRDRPSTAATEPTFEIDAQSGQPHDTGSPTPSIESAATASVATSRGPIRRFMGRSAMRLRYGLAVAIRQSRAAIRWIGRHLWRFLCWVASGRRFFRPLLGWVRDQARRGGAWTVPALRGALTTTRQFPHAVAEQRRRAEFRRQVEDQGAMHLRVGVIDEADRYLTEALEAAEARGWSREATLCRTLLADVAASRDTRATALQLSTRLNAVASEASMVSEQVSDGGLPPPPSATPQPARIEPAVVVSPSPWPYPRPPAVE